ncbi:MAG: hypothetical protein AAB426_14025 [Myxococcota bacterium]
MYLLGGDAERVDTEDVAVRASQLIPGRFAWRKYPEQINIEVVRAALSDAKKPQKGALLLGSGVLGWSLTPAGARFSLEQLARLPKSAVPQPRLAPVERRWRRSELERIGKTPALLKFRRGRLKSISKREAETVFRLNDYITGEARRAKIDRIVGAFGSDPTIGKAVQAIRHIVEDEVER